jgi:hypothetical protein
METSGVQNAYARLFTLCVTLSQTHVLHLILKSLLVDYLARDLNHQEGSKCTIL